MASIPGPIVFIAGLVVSAFSFFLNKKSFAMNGAYALFLYIGILIMFYGFVKILIWFITRESKSEKKEEVQQNIVASEQARLQEGSVYDKIQKEDPDEDRYKMVLKCRNCGMNHYVYNNFCSNCGMRLPK